MDGDRVELCCFTYNLLVKLDLRLMTEYLHNKWHSHQPQTYLDLSDNYHLL